MGEEDNLIELERLAEADHRAALILGKQIDSQLLAPEHRVRYERALGNACRTLSQMDAAFAHYAAGISIAVQANLGESEGLIRMSRAGAYSIVGDQRQAIRDLSKAEQVTTGFARGRVLFQRAAVVQRFSEGLDALAAYGKVIPVLEEHDDQLFLAHALSNRGLLYVHHGDQISARADLEAALKLYELLGLASPAAVVVHNLGLVHARLLDFPGALDRFDSAEERLRALGRPLAGLHLDRAEVLLSAGLAEDALALAEATVRYLRRRNLQTDLAEALLVSAQASLVAGRPDVSQLAAEAVEAFAKQLRPGWRDRAQVVRLEALVLEGRGSVSDERLARRLEDRLERAGQRGPASRAALVAGMLAAARGGVRSAERSLTRGSFARSSGLIEDRLAYWSLAASVRLAGGNRTGAMSAARAGLADLAKFSRQISAPDARAGVAIHADRMIGIGLRAAADSPTARTMFEWFERSAAVYEPTSPAAAPANTELAGFLNQLRDVTNQLAETSEDLVQQQQLRHRRSKLEASIKRETRRQSHDSGAISGSRKRPRTATEPSMVVAFVNIAGTTFRCDRDEEGRCSLHDLGRTVLLEREIRSAAMLFRRMVSQPSSSTAARLHRSLETLDGIILSGLRPSLDRIVVLPRGATALVPWSALPRLEAVDSSVASSLAAWRRAASIDRPRDTGTTVIVGPRLTMADREAKLISNELSDVTVLDGERATADGALAALARPGNVHFICHGEFRADNPLFSHLELADGPLTVYDVVDAGEVAAGTVVLSACSGAEMSVRPEQAFIGMSGAFLAAGVQSLIASVFPVRDAVGTATLMASLHRNLATGLPPASALRLARSGLADPSERSIGGAFVTIGAG